MRGGGGKRAAFIISFGVNLFSVCEIPELLIFKQLDLGVSKKILKDPKSTETSEGELCLVNFAKLHAYLVGFLTFNHSRTPFTSFLTCSVLKSCNDLIRTRTSAPPSARVQA